MATTTEDDLAQVANLEEIYDTKYRPATQKIYSMVPRQEKESGDAHALRISLECEKHEGLSDALDTATSAGKSFIRLFEQAFAKEACNEYFDESGWARLLNIFQLIAPYSLKKWLTLQDPTKPIDPATFTWYHIFLSLNCDHLLKGVWENCIHSKSLQNPEPFSTVTIQALSREYEKTLDFKR